jgi:tetratricopeptide (TPR) repeat protein
MLKSWLFQRRWIFVSVGVLVGLMVAGDRVYLWWQITVARQTLASGHPDVAITLLERTAAFAPDNAEVQYLLAVAERRFGHLDRVSTPLRRAARLGWPKDDIERQSLLVLAQNGDIDEHDGRLKSIMLREVADDVAEEIYEALAIGYLKTYRLKEAWECLNAWSNWQPQAIFPKIWRADICHRINNRPGEESEYRAILAIDSKHCETRRRLADLLKDSNRVDEARQEYERCLQSNAATSEVLIGLAECHRRLAQMPSAISLLKQAQDQNLSAVQNASVLFELGQIAAEEGRFHEAIAKLDEATRLAPYQASIWYSLSQAHARTGDEVRSRELLERSERIRSQSLRAEEITQQLLKTPNNAELRYEIGKIMMDLGMKKEGAGWLQTVIQIQPDHRLALEALAEYVAEGPAQSQASPREN